MDNQQNIKKTENIGYGQIDLSDKKYLQNKPSLPVGKSTYTFAIKKTEKLITALYMVTDCMEADDALKNKLRLLGIELLSFTHRLPLLGSFDERATGSEAFARINEIFSLIEIAYNLGYVSEMNATVLKKEFNILADELGLQQTSKALVLSDNLFAVEEDQTTGQELFNDNLGNKKTDLKMSFMNKDVLYNEKRPALFKVQHQDLQKIKLYRKERILKLIKDKKEVSIKDISTAFTDCSEKTIQRELNDLVSKGQIKKIGEKRWSRYSI